MSWLTGIKNFLFVKSTELNSIELKRVIVSNITITLCFLLSLLFGVFLFYFKVYPLNILFIFCACLYLVCWQISVTGNYLTSKIILYCTILAQCLGMSIVLGKNVDLKLFYLSVAIIPLIIFGKQDRRFLYLSFFITAANVSLIYFTRNSYNPRYSYDSIVYESISIAINFISVLCLIIMSFIFLHLTEAGEAEAHTLNQQLLGKQNELLQSKEELDRINQLKDHLFKIMTHDLKSPLNNISAMAELMMNEKITRDEIKFLSERFKQTADNTSQMLDNILSWSVRQITQKAPEIISLSILVNRVFGQIQDKAELKKISLMNQIPESFMVKTDPEMLEIVLRNLLTNSVKFTNKGGQIRVDAIEMKNRFVLRVEDNGIGIPKILLTNLFGNNRLSSRVGTNMEKGSGIGLLLCKQLVESCDGKIAIQSEEGRFTIVTIEIPF